MILTKRYNLLVRLSLKHLNNVELNMINCDKPPFGVDCDCSTSITTLWNTQITDELELDKSIN